MSGTWPPKKDELAYSYIPGQYKYMGSEDNLKRQFNFKIIEVMVLY